MKIDKKKLASIKIVFFDFDGVFTDNKVYISEDGLESVVCSRSDGMGIKRLKSIGIEPYIISTEVNPVVSARAKKLSIDCQQAIDNKEEALKNICLEKNIDLKDTMFVGNDINDISALDIVGIAIAVNDSEEEIFPHVDYVTKRKGGNGAIREVCDAIFHSINNE
jgi:3-deoxy-D-manno-octulosonate 8-phosphate phosphatase (KDO 8-P phosphatase)